MIEQKKPTTLDEWWETLERVDKEREAVRLENERRKDLYNRGITFTAVLKTFR
jgi:hypothetical protein